MLKKQNNMKITKKQVQEFKKRIKEAPDSYNPVSEYLDLSRDYSLLDKSYSEEAFSKADKLAKSCKDLILLAEFFCSEENSDNKKARDYYLKAIQESNSNIPNLLTISGSLKRSLKDDALCKKTLTNCFALIENSTNYQDLSDYIWNFINLVYDCEDKEWSSVVSQKVAAIFHEMIIEGTLNGVKQNVRISTTVINLNHCFGSILNNLYNAELKIQDNAYIDISKKWISLLLVAENKARDSNDYCCLASLGNKRLRPSIDGNVLANGWYSKAVDLVDDIESLETYFMTMTEGGRDVPDILIGKVAKRALELAKTFYDYKFIVLSDFISDISIDGSYHDSPISEIAIDIAIKLKDKASEEDLEDFILYLEESDLSDRVEELRNN